MKKLIALLLLGVGFASCSEKNNEIQITPPEQIEEPQPEVHEFDITIYAAHAAVSINGRADIYDTQIRDNGKSDDEFVATISNGVITAQHVGETRIYVGENTYNVTVVSPWIETFIPPVTEFGKSKDYIAGKEIRKFAQATSFELIYYGECDGIERVIYIFGSNNGYLEEIRIQITNSAWKYLRDLYEEIGVEKIDGLYYYVYINAYNMKDATFKVYLPNPYPTGATTITYIPTNN